MNNFYYSTDSEEHSINIGEKSEDQWDELTRIEMEEDLTDSWDKFMESDHSYFTAEEE